jgi:hypothetical protein
MKTHSESVNKEREKLIAILAMARMGESSNENIGLQTAHPIEGI